MDNSVPTRLRSAAAFHGPTSPYYETLLDAALDLERLERGLRHAKTFSQCLHCGEQIGLQESHRAVAVDHGFVHLHCQRFLDATK